MCIGLVSLLARLPGSKLCEVISPQRVFFMFAILSALSALVLPLATTLIRFICYASVYGLADGMMAIGGILSCFQALTPKQKAQGFGFYQFFICSAYLCGPPIGGKLPWELNYFQWIIIPTCTWVRRRSMWPGVPLGVACVAGAQIPRPPSPFSLSPHPLLLHRLFGSTKQ